MEIELPDGTVLDAPDGVDVKKVVQGYRLKQRIASDPGEYDAKSPEYKEKYGAEGGAGVAFQSGVQRVLAGMGNLGSKMRGTSPLARTLSSAMGAIPSVTSDRAISNRDEIDAPLKEDHPVARIGGEVAATLPLTLASGGAAGASTGGNILARTLLHPTTRAAVEGVIPGMATADVDSQAEGGATGAVASAVLERFFKGSGRLVKGLVQKSQAAKDLADLAAQHGEEIDVPLSQAAGDQDMVTRLVKTGYQEGLPLIPGVKGKLMRQGENALAKTRELALREASPSGTALPAEAGKNVGESVHAIGDSIENEYAQTVKAHSFNIPPTLGQDVSAAIKKALPTVDDTTTAKVATLLESTMGRFASGKGVIDGENLANVRTVLGRTKVAPEEQAALRVAQQHVDDMIEAELSSGQSVTKAQFNKALKAARAAGASTKEMDDMIVHYGKTGTIKSASNVADLQRFKDIAEPERQFVGLKKAAEAARAQGGNFTMGQLARNATDPTQLHLASTGNELFSQPAASSSLPGRIIAGLAIGGYGAFVEPASALTAFVAGNAMATKTAQKALMGDLKVQKAIVKLMQDHPEAVDKIQRVLRTAASLEGGDLNGRP